MEQGLVKLIAFRKPPVWMVVVIAFAAVCPLMMAQDRAAERGIDPNQGALRAAPPARTREEMRQRMGIQLRAGIANALIEESSRSPGLEAALNTSEELERLLERAVQVAAERPDLAPVLWQRILDEGANTFARAGMNSPVPLRRSYELYRPFSNESLKAMVAAGPEALRYYRLHSDGPARALLARKDGDREKVLAEIVRRYFLTTVGDDAAFELACRLLERGDFTSADPLLDRLALFPDSNIRREEISIRRAVTQSKLGRQAAALALADALSADFDSLKPLLVEEINRNGSSKKSQSEAAQASALSSDAVSETLALDWEYQPQWTLKGVKKSANNQAIMSGRVNGRPMIFVRQPGGNYVQTTLDDKDIPALGFSELASQWQTAGWRPASSPVIQDGRVYLKSEARTICVDAGSGTVRWMGRPTRFPIDDWSRQLAQVAAHGVNVSYPSASLIAGRQPKTLTEIMLFSDRLHHGLAVEGGRVFAVEGELDTPSARKQTTDAALERRAPGAQLPSQSSRHNELACYDALTGRMIWTATRGAGLPERASLWSGPLVVGSQVLVAIGIDTQLEIAALDVATGQTIWKTSLAELGRAAPTIPVGLTVDDGSLYVASGAGTLFSLDRNGGALRWAASYPRLKTSASERRAIEMNAAPRVQIVLDENFVARDGDLVVLAASDSDHIMAFDVTDGSLRWDSPLPPAAMGSSLAYVIGLADGRMQLANDKCLWSVNTGGGRIVWDLPLEGSYGRGLLADGRLFVPQRRTILELDPATGRAIGKADVATPDSEPVGNLIAAGDHLLVASAARLLSVKPEKAPGIDPMQDSNTSPPGVKP